MQNSNPLRLATAVGFLFLSLACSGPGSSSAPAEVAPSASKNYSYGNRELPGTLPALSADYRPLHLASKIFTTNSVTFVPMNFAQVDLVFTFDVAASKAAAHAIVNFELAETGRPYFQLSPAILNAQLDGVPVTTAPISDPEGASESYVSLSSIASQGPHRLEIDYELKSDSLSFANGGVAILTDMTDLSNAHYFETWGPGSFEDDSFAMNLSLNIQNSSVAHSLFTNGQILSETANQSWQIQLAKHFTTSSFYFHLTNKALLHDRFQVPGQSKSIPVVLYSSEQALIDQAKSLLPGWFQEFEHAFGPYPHDSFTAYLQSGGGGMEYSGATISSIAALDHELFHSWFARGVMPAEGRAGWIDEAFASWRDYDYFQAPSLLSRTPTYLANASVYEKSTPSNCYRDGRQLIAELDRLFADFGGMKPLMRQFFERYKHQVVTTEEFWNFLAVKSGLNVDVYFQRYTFGQAANDQSQEAWEFEIFPDQDRNAKHPLPLTKDEVRNLR